MISKRLSNIIFKSTRSTLLTKNIRFFADSTDNLKNIISAELQYEEKNYEPVSASDRKTFFNNSKFNFVEEENSPRMSLTKSQNGYDVKVYFTARAPTPEEDEANKEQQGNIE